MNPELKAHLLSLETWLRGLVAAFLSGASTALLSAIGVSGAQELGVNIPRLTFKQMGVIALVGGLVGLAAYLKQSPIPPDPDAPRNGGRFMLVLLPLLFLQGCSTPSGTIVQDQPPQAQQFWDAMKGAPDKARAFLASDAAKRNAPLFFKVAWRASFAGFAAADGDVKPLCRNIVYPACSVLASATGASGVSAAQAQDLAERFGADWESDRYNPLVDMMSPILVWVVQSLPEDPQLALFYLHAAAQAGKEAAQPYLSD